MSATPQPPETAPPLVPPVQPKDPILLQTPPGFRIAPCIALSPVGVLPPHLYEPAQGAMQIALPSKLVRNFELYPCTEVLIHEVPGHAALLVYGLWPGTLAEVALDKLRWMFGLEEDLTLFHHLCSRDRELPWVAEQRIGQILRSPTVFEDLVKVVIVSQRPKQAAAICQTLCSTFGSPTMLARHSFPEAAQLASVKESVLTEELGLGPLGKLIWRLAVRCAEGQPEPETLRRVRPSFSAALAGDDETLFDDLIGEELQWQERLTDLLLTLPGFGIRSVPPMLRLLGCFDLVEMHKAALTHFAKRYPPRRKRAEPESSDEILARLLKRVDGFAIYRGLAQSLLLLPPERKA